MALQSTEIAALTVCVYGPCPSNDKTRLQAQDLVAHSGRRRLLLGRAFDVYAIGSIGTALCGYSTLSTLHDVNKLSNGTLRMVHFDSKAAIDNYAESLRGDKIDVSCFHAAILVQNFTEQLRKGEHGSLSITLPHGAASHFTDQFVLRPGPGRRLPQNFTLIHVASYPPHRKSHVNDKSTIDTLYYEESTRTIYHSTTIQNVKLCV
ncbi:hypothetical protein NDA18_004380 [Ustilago nuda]|nr:hypothetical protein NDA18_004380 [Ustilago nuda]